jgi:hypothetical protein
MCFAVAWLVAVFISSYQYCRGANVNRPQAQFASFASIATLSIDLNTKKAT